MEIELDRRASRMIRERSARSFRLFSYSIPVLFEVSSDRLTVICTYLPELDFTHFGYCIQGE